MDKSSELKAVESQWKTLDDSSIIRDVLFKGKFISNALKFISERSNISIDDTKLIFFEVTGNIVKLLVQNKQLHRAVHVLKNAQLNETHYLFNLAQECSDKNICDVIMDFLKKSSEGFDTNEKIIKANHICFKLLILNIQKHLKYLDNVNRSHDSFVITPYNIKNPNIIFGTFMKQKQVWRNEIAVDVFFKSKRHPEIIFLLPILEKESFFGYVIQNELYGLLKRWINEQYLSRAGKAIQSTISEPETFDEALNHLFREWKFDQTMMDRISRREKDVIKNEFAKLGLFESREAKCVSRKLNRLFTTHTFDENYHLAIRSEELTKFVIENKLVGLLNEKFIDHNYIQSVLESNSQLLRDELTLLEAMKNLFSKETSIEDFVNISKTTTSYIQKYDKSFDENRTDLVIVEGILENDLQNFKQLAERNSFLRNLYEKLTTTEELPTLEFLLEKFHSINVDFIREEFSNDFPSFDDPQMSSTYGENFSLSYLDYVKQYQGVYATYKFIIEMIKNSMTISRPQIMSGCEEVANLATENCQDEKLVAHAIAFIECFNVDTKNLRQLLKLLRLKQNEEKGFEKFLNSTIQAGPSDDEIKLVEALETFWSVKKYEIPTRGYLDKFLDNDDWFRFVLFAQYFNYPLESFVSICEQRIKNKTLADNLITAVSYDVPNMKRPENFSKLHRSKVSVPETALNLFKNGKFLDKKHDLFAILLKCNETVSRVDLPFDEFQRFFLRDQSDEIDDLVFQARKYDWPILAVLAATTTLYRIKYCFLTWLILSSDFKIVKKFENIEELSKSVFEHCLKIGFIRTLNESALIFYPDSSFDLFTNFLLNTKNGNFTDMESLLKRFIVKISENDFKMVIIKGKEQLLSFIFNCLILHLEYNIKFGLQEQYLECIHKSEVGIFLRKIDFGLLQQISKVLDKTRSRINYQTFCDGEKKSSKEIERILEELIDSDHYEEAVEIAELMKIPKSDFVMKIWRHMYEKEDQKNTSFDIEKYLKYVESFKLKMEIFIKFLTSIVDGMIDCIVKYNIMVFILKNSKSRNDSLEYDIIYLYIRLKCENVENIEPLTSEHYQETICKRKNLIHESLYELKSIAQIDELLISFKSLKNKREIEELDNLILHLLDINDMVQVLRIQEMFGHAADDLKIIVYMLSVCEGLTSIYDISKQERQEISSYVSGQMSNIFHRFTLRVYTTDLNESLVTNDSSRYQENKETFQALQGLVSKIKHGIKYGQRIVLVYRASLFLNQSFKELMKIRNSFEFLELASLCDGENRLLVMSDIIVAMDMTDIEVAEFISKEIVACIIRTRFLQFNTELLSTSSGSLNRSQNIIDEIWGFSLSKDLHLIFELCKGKTTLLGNYLLKYYKILSQSVADIPIHAEDEELEKLCELLNQTMSPQIMSQKKQNIIRVEILIVAHDCFCQECSTEGIAKILNLTKNLVNILADKKSFNLIVRLLCGIGRFREMFYAFDILIKNEVFEALLGQFNEKQANGLKNAILCYLNENHPNNREYFKMAAAHFSMYTELANQSRTTAMEKLQKVIGESQVKRLKSGRITTNQVQQVEIPYLKCNNKNVIATLHEALNDMMQATEMAVIDNKIEMSLKFAAFCELIAMQIHLVKLGDESEEKLCPCVINFEQHAEKFQYFANYELSVPQTMILNKNIESSIDYSKSILIRSIINGDSSQTYLSDYIRIFDLTDEMIENLVKLAQLESIENKQEKILHDLVMRIKNCDLKFKLASLLGLKDILQQMLNDEQTYYYLLDSKYGNVDIF